MIVYRARCVLPVSAPPLLDGGAVCVVDDRIVAVGRPHEVAPAGARPVDLGDVVLMPGLVNAHTHLELAWTGARRPPGGDWVAWVEDLVELRASGEPDGARDVVADVLTAMIRRGTVAVGDIANGTTSLTSLSESGLHGIVFHELLQPRAESVDATFSKGIDAMLHDRRTIEACGAGDRLRVALTAHAPHSTAPGLIRAIAHRSIVDRTPLSVHVAESSAESTWLSDGTGPWSEFLRRRGVDDPGWAPPGESPLRWLDRCGAVRNDSLLVHGVGFDRDDVALVRERGAVVVTCPRSNAYLDVGSAPIPELLAAGVRVALGTDSLASCPDADMFAEMHALRERHPGLAPADVVATATIQGARALGLAGTHGSIEPGKVAAMVAVPRDGRYDDPYEAVTSLPVDVTPVGVFGP